MVLRHNQLRGVWRRSLADHPQDRRSGRNHISFQTQCGFVFVLASRDIPVYPGTGLPFPGNVIPPNRLNAALQSLLGASSRCQTSTATPGTSTTSRRTPRRRTPSTCGSRITSRPNAGGRAWRTRRAGARAAFGGPGGRFGRGQQQGTSVNMTGAAALPADGAIRTTFSSLAGTTTGASLALPVSLNIQHKRTTHTISRRTTRARCRRLNQYRLRRGRRRRRRHRGRVDQIRSTGACRSSRSPACGRARHHAVPADRRRGSASATAGRGRSRPGTRCGSAAIPARSLRKPDRPQCPGRVRVHRPVLVRGGSMAARGRARLRRLPPRPAAAGDGAVWPGQCADVRPVVQCVRRRTTGAKQHADVQPGRALRAHRPFYELVRRDGATSTSPRALPRRCRWSPAKAGPFTARFRRHFSTGHEQRGAACRLRLAGAPGDDHSRRIWHQLQRRIVLVDRAAARGNRPSRPPTTPSAPRSTPRLCRSVCGRLAGRHHQHLRRRSGLMRWDWCRRGTRTFARHQPGVERRRRAIRKRAAPVSTSPRAEPGSDPAADSRRPAIPLADIGGLVGAARGHVPGVRAGR